MKFATVRAFALALPGASEAPHHHYGSFRVGGKIFVTVPPEQAFINVFIPEARREEVLALHSGFAEKLLWGGKVVGVSLRLAGADAAAVKQLVREAWEHKAAKGKGA
ncbi:MmcQ/YjbR family DNA-binding protein [Massilia sp. SR12]